MKMTNRWNRFIYRLWAPIYDSTVNHFFLPGRKRAMQLLDLQPGEKVLLLGVGTAADSPLLNLLPPVLPEGQACLQSALRALKPGGRPVIFDKFLPEGKSISPVRKF